MDQGDEAISIREMEFGDAAAVAELSGELGYPATEEEMRERIGQLLSLNDSIAFVACVAGALVGWIDVAIARHLSAGRYAEIAGLIVSSSHRSGGVGQKLVSRAEQWAVDHGIDKMVVRSRVTREAAHRFYLREGYVLTKTSAVFSKQLIP